MSKFPVGAIDFFETPTINVKPLSCRTFELNTLIYSVVHTNCPDITEQIDAHYQDMIQRNIYFGLKAIKF